MEASKVLIKFIKLVFRVVVVVVGFGVPIIGCARSIGFFPFLPYQLTMYSPGWENWSFVFWLVCVSVIAYKVLKTLIDHTT